MPVDVIIDPSSGQIYWNDAAGSGTQTIAISGNATNAINIVGYSNFFSPGGGGLGTQILATFTDSATSTFTPGTNAYDLGSSSLRWNFYGTGGNFTGAISTSSTTASTSSTTGALIVTGGAGIAKTSYFAQDVKIQGSTASTNQTTGALVVTGGVGIGGTLHVGIASTNYNPYNVVAGFFGNASDSDGLTVAIQNTRSDILSNSQLIFLDNLGAKARIRFWNGNDFFPFYNNTLEIIGPGEIVYHAGLGSSSFHNFSGGNGVSVLHTTVSTSSTSGALTVTGGAGIAKTSYFGQDVKIQGSTASGSTTTGALVVTGGVGIGGSLNVFGTIDVSNNIEVLSQKEVRFFNSANTFYTGLRAGSSSANVTFTLPVADGSANQVLYTNGSAALGWTSLASAITTLNGLTAATQTFATGTSGTDFNISSSTSTHTFNIPYAGSGATGLITTQTQTIAGAKTFSGNTIVSSSTASTSSTTGALVVTGGAGIAKTSYFGQDVKILGTTSSFSSNTGALTVVGGVGISGNLNVTVNADPYLDPFLANFTTNSNDFVSVGIENYNSGTEASSTLRVESISGTVWLGIGSTNNSLIDSFFGGNVPYKSGYLFGWDRYVGGMNAGNFSVGAGSTLILFVNDGSNSKIILTGTGVSISATTASTSSTSGALRVAGGAGIAKTSYFGQSVVVQGTTASGSTTTGALVVTGGVGIGGSLNVFGTIDVSNNIEVLSQKEVRFFNSANTFYTGLRAGSPSANVTFTLPVADGSTNQVLYTNGSAALGWTTVASVSAITSLNGLTAATQTFATGTSGTDFNISSSTSTHTFNIPYAGSGATGLITTQAQTIAGSKTFSSQTIISDTTVSSSTATGALLVYGGLGVTGQINAASLQTSGNAVISGNLTFNGVGVFGNATSDTINSLARYISDILPSTDNSYDLGNNSLGWRNFRVSGVGTIASLAVTSTTASTSTSTGALTVTGGVGIGGSLWTSTSNLASVSGVTLNNGTITGTLSGTATSAQVLATTTDTSSTLYLLGSRSSTGFAGTTLYVDTNISFSGSTVTASLTGTATTATAAIGVNVSNAATNSTHYIRFSPTATGTGLATSTNTSLTYNPSTNILSATTFSGSFSGSLTGTASIATSSVNSATTTDTTSTLYLLGSRSSTGFAGTALYVDSSISILGSQITAGVWGGTAISAVNGGTGQVSYTVGDLLYASSTTALSKLAAGTAGSVLKSNGAGTAPSWQVDSTGSGGGGTVGAPSASGLIAYYPGTGASVASTPFVSIESANSAVQISSQNSKSALILNAANGSVVNLAEFKGPFGDVFWAFGTTGQELKGTNGQLKLNSASYIQIASPATVRFYNTAETFYTAITGSTTVSSNVTYTLPPTAPATGTSVLQSSTGGTLSWVAMSSGGSGTVTSGTAGSIAYYTGTGTTVGGSPGFTYTTSGTASTINVFGGSAIGTTIFTVQATSSTSVRVGIGTNLPQYELEIVGELSATNKSFVIDHPTKPGKKLRYGSLEGPENGVYVRGELKDSNIIETPDHWIGLVYPDSFTVTLTPIGRFSYLYVEKIEDYKVFIADAYMNPIHCYYTVWAERKDIPKLVTEY